MLGGYDTDFTFQIFSDSNHISLKPKILDDTFDNLKGELASQNRKGAGVFVTVNETDGKGRKAENIVRIRAVWQDDDNGFEGELPLEPTLEVETSPGKFHRYWVIDPEYGEMSFETFDAVMSVLVEEYGSDPNAKDRSRVLRLPGSMHMKNTPSHLVKIVGGSKERYPVEVIVSAFLERSDTREVSEEEKPKGPKLKYEWDWEKIKDALRFLSSDERSSWFKYGAAIHSASGGSMRGLRIWDEWSKTTTAGNYDPDEQERYWQKEFKRSQGVTEATIFRDAMANGWEPWEQGGQEVCEDNSDSGFNAPTVPRSEASREALCAVWDDTDEITNLDGFKVDGDELAKAAIANVEDLFKKWGHSPSVGHWDGLRDIAKVYQSMAAGVCAPSFYLSSLPCGMGKTTVATECTKALLSGDHYGDEGVIYFLSRLEEINSLVSAMGLGRTDFAVLVSEGRKGDVQELGSGDITNARVLFTTQQQLEARLKGGKSFAEISAFHYRGKPRSVRVWDEAIVPSKILTLERDDINSMLRELGQGGFRELRDILEEWSIDLKSKDTGELVEVPDVHSHLHSLEGFREVFSGPIDQDKAEALWYLSGRLARVRRNQDSKATTLDYEDNLPEDLAPMLILDASGGLRKTYSFWQRHRGGLRRLRAPEKTYAGLTIHHWNRGAGKSAYKSPDKATEIADGVARAINAEIPRGEESLVIFHKQVMKRHPDMVRLISERIYPDAKVNFCNWGKHTATNQYAHIKHVILAGILQYNEAQYEATGRAAKKARAEDEFGEDDFQRTRFGEIAHNIFQAACRGTVRKTVDGDCPSGCHLYLIFSTDKKRGFSRAGLERIFPKAPIIDWQPIQKELTGKAKEAFDLIQNALLSVDKVTSSEVMSAMGMADKGNFANLVKRDDLRDALAKAGIDYVKATGRTQSYFLKEVKESPWMVKAAPIEPLPF